MDTTCIIVIGSILFSESPLRAEIQNIEDIEVKFFTSTEQAESYAEELANGRDYLVLPHYAGEVLFPPVSVYKASA